ncbi:MAG: DUF4923 family protein [Bacteroidaceae bacterium]|nr:DUF4923 family protein [Bacteroidaceae bacterium]
MKVFKNLAVATFMSASALFTSCGMSPNGQTGNQELLSGIAAGLLGTTGTNGTAGADLGALIGNVIGAMTTQSGASIVGTWVYTSPTIEFESSNFLAQAGGAIAGQQVASKMNPYFEKLGLKAGAVSITFNQNGTCVYATAKQQYNGNYTYDANTHTLQIVGATTAIKFPKCNASIGLNNLNLTFKTTELLNVIQSLGSKTNNNALSTISTLAGQFNGMQAGLQFQRK